ncbi:MAG TPA: hypothetical protein ENH82_14020 [bacterium]|nr:hypothetical protein [bacterium]
MPFKKGNPGGPGVPKGSTHILPKYRNKSLKQICKDLTLSVVMPRLELLARKRNEWAMETILHYGHGKPIQAVHQVNLNLNYSSWSDAQIEEFSETGQMPMISGDSEDNKLAKDTKPALNDKTKEVKE